jgi:hypothetical protein
MHRAGLAWLCTYNLGDSWERAIVLEKQLPVDPNASLSGMHGWSTRCPPGGPEGIPGFYDLVEAIADPNHAQHKELKDWLGYDFDPLAFSIDSVNRIVLPVRRRRKAPQRFNQVSSTTQACQNTRSTV